MTFLQMSLAGGVLVAVAMIIRWIFANRLPRWAYQTLWGLALARFLIPFSIPSPVSAFTMAAKSPALSGALYAATFPALAPAAATNQTLSTAATPAPAALVSSASAFTEAAAEFPWLTFIWIAGAVLTLAFFVVTHLRARSIYAQSLPCRDRRVLASVMKTKSFRRVSVRVSDRIMAPLTYGVLRPVILLPKHVDDEGREFVLAHELCHIKRFDVLWKGLLVLSTCIHWFNPMAWALLIMSNRELELSCDSAVVRNKSEQIRKDYALTLLHLEEKKALLNPLASGFNKSAIEERIKEVLKMKRKPAWAVFASIALVIVCAAAFATSAPPIREEVSQVEQPLAAEGATNAETEASDALSQGEVTFAELGFPGGGSELPETEYALLGELFKRALEKPSLGEMPENGRDGSFLSLIYKAGGKEYQVYFYPLWMRDEAWFTVRETGAVDSLIDCVIEDSEIVNTIRKMTGYETYRKAELNGASAVEYRLRDLPFEQNQERVYETLLRIEDGKAIKQLTKLLLDGKKEIEYSFSGLGLFVFEFPDGTRRNVYTTFTPDIFDLSAEDLDTALCYIGGRQLNVSEKKLIDLLRPLFEAE